MVVQSTITDIAHTLSTYRYREVKTNITKYSTNDTRLLFGVTVIK